MTHKDKNHINNIVRITIAIFDICKTKLSALFTELKQMAHKNYLHFSIVFKQKFSFAG